jgi:hypothetical protein
MESKAAAIVHLFQRVATRRMEFQRGSNRDKMVWHASF